MPDKGPRKSRSQFQSSNELAPEDRCGERIQLPAPDGLIGHAQAEDVVVPQPEGVDDGTAILVDPLPGQTFVRGCEHERFEVRPDEHRVDAAQRVRSRRGRPP